MPVSSILVLSAALALAEDPPISTFASPSGEWSLTVTRPDKDWNGANELVQTRAGVEVWRVKLELGLRAAFVSDEGCVAGYGYTGEGLADATPPVFPSDLPLGRVLHVFVLGPDGGVRLDEEHARHGSLYPDGHAEPAVAGAFLQGELGRFVLRVPDEDANRQQEEWWGYDLATGKALVRERPKEKLGLGPAIHASIDARPVPGTRLVLVQWWRTGPEPGASGVLFQLLDPAWKVLWTLELPRDYERERNGYPPRDERAILGVAPHSFELRLAAEKKRVTFTVKPEGDGWSVAEVARQPFVARGEPGGRAR